MAPVTNQANSYEYTLVPIDIFWEILPCLWILFQAIGVYEIWDTQYQINFRESHFCTEFAYICFLMQDNSPVRAVFKNEYIDSLSAIV